MPTVDSPGYLDFGLDLDQKATGVDPERSQTQRIRWAED